MAACPYLLTVRRQGRQAYLQPGEGRSWSPRLEGAFSLDVQRQIEAAVDVQLPVDVVRSEEHTSELQSLAYLVCRLLLEKKKQEVRAVKASRDIMRRHLAV